MHKDKNFRLCFILAILMVTLACKVHSNDRDNEPDANILQPTQQIMQITQTIMSTEHKKPVPVPDSGGIQETNDGSGNPISSDSENNVDGGYALKLLGETIPDGTRFWFGNGFTKTWTARNTGDLEWTEDFTLDFVNGYRMNGASSTKLGRTVNPGETITLSVDLTPPNDPGDYTARWHFSIWACLSHTGKLVIRFDRNTSAKSLAHPGSGSENRYKGSRRYRL